MFWKNVLVVAVLSWACMTDAMVVEESQVDVVAKESESEHNVFRDLRRRRRKRRRGANKFSTTDGFEDVCQIYYERGVVDQFSACESNLVQVNNVNPSSSCDGLEFGVCTKTNGCIWRQLSNLGERCIADPCYRINNARCTIQHTGGRCVWYTKAHNKKTRGLNHPGCYISPCNNIRKPGECVDAGDDIYECTWCGKHQGISYGCQNKKPTSSAQCYNVGDVKDCSSCKTKMGKDCKSKKCANSCCDSPYCTCIKEEPFGRDPDGLANDILTGDNAFNGSF